MGIDFKRLQARLGQALLAVCCMACTAANPLQGKPDPNELWAFFERRELCDHLRGEMPAPEGPDATRDAVASINEYCTPPRANLD